MGCHDLGQFILFHPQGRYIVADLRGKELVMRLMSHPDPDVQKQALLCVQKIMLGKVGLFICMEHLCAGVSLLAIIVLLSKMHTVMRMLRMFSVNPALSVSRFTAHRLNVWHVSQQCKRVFTKHGHAMC